MHDAGWLVLHWLRMAAKIVQTLLTCIFMVGQLQEVFTGILPDLSKLKFSAVEFMYLAQIRTGSKC
jgi:hypothetical protein